MPVGRHEQAAGEVLRERGRVLAQSRSIEHLGLAAQRAQQLELLLGFAQGLRAAAGEQQPALLKAELHARGQRGIAFETGE